MSTQLNNELIMFLQKAFTEGFSTSIQWQDEDGYNHNNYQVTPETYRKGYEIVELFNKFGGYNYLYDSSFGSRSSHVKHKLIELNENFQLIEFLEKYLSQPQWFINRKSDLIGWVELLYPYLQYDGYSISTDNNKTSIYKLNGNNVSVLNANKITRDFAQQQLSKIESKLNTTDYDGVITNARSLLEDVICKGIYKDKNGIELETKGELLKDWRELAKTIKLDPDDFVDGRLKEVTRGFISIINGLASLSNKMGDRHTQNYAPERHHAILASNSVKTIIDFLYDITEYQNKLKP